MTTSQRVPPRPQRQARRPVVQVVVHQWVTPHADAQTRTHGLIFREDWGAAHRLAALHGPLPPVGRLSSSVDDYVEPLVRLQPTADGVGRSGDRPGLPLIDRHMVSMLIFRYPKTAHRIPASPSAK